MYSNTVGYIYLAANIMLTNTNRTISVLKHSYAIIYGPSSHEIKCKKGSNKKKENCFFLEAIAIEENYNQQNTI